MCRNSGDTVDHLLLYCDIAYELWTFTFTMFETQWVLPKSVIELLLDGGIDWINILRLYQTYYLYIPFVEGKNLTYF